MKVADLRRALASHDADAAVLHSDGEEFTDLVVRRYFNPQGDEVVEPDHIVLMFAPPHEKIG